MFSTSDKIALTEAILVPFNLLFVIGAVALLVYMFDKVINGDDDEPLRPA